jgi:diacylglycerol O-acyltransferase
VSLHSGSTHALNRDSYFSLPLPLHLVDPLERLGAVRRATMARKEAHDAERMDLMIHELASVSPKLQRIVQALQASSREFAVSISNVAVSHEPVTILARSVTSIWPVAEIGLRHALRVCATSIGDTLTFGMCVDPDIIEDIDLLADGLEDEIALLVAATKI